MPPFLHVWLDPRSGGPFSAATAWLSQDFDSVISNSSLETGRVQEHFPAVAVGRLSAKTMRFFLLAEGAVAMIAAVASYLWGYLDGRADIRAQWKKAIVELRDFD